MRLVGEGSRRLAVGSIDVLDSGGGGGVYGTFADDLTGFDAVAVRDARGRVLLHGTLSVYEPTP